MKNKDGGPAFPRAAYKYNTAVDGMSLRDWFAGQVIIEFVKDESPQYDPAVTVVLARRQLMYAAEHAYRIADAMLKAREE